MQMRPFVLGALMLFDPIAFIHKCREHARKNPTVGLTLSGLHRTSLGYRGLAPSQKVDPIGCYP